ncbi:MAG TPA: hypothetical protein VIP31_01900 [Acidovorax sp.]
MYSEFQVLDPKLKDAIVEKEKIWLFGILIFGAAFRILSVIFLHHEPASDELAYLAMAKNFLDGRGLQDSMGNFAFYNAGYPLLVLIPTSYVFNEVLDGARYVNVLLGVVSVHLCYLIAREVGLGVVGRLSSATMYAAYLPTGVYAVYIAKETLLTFLMLVLALCVVRLSRGGTLANSFVAAISVTLIALVGNAGLALMASLGLALLLGESSGTKRILTAVGIFSLAFVLLLPWLHRNQRVVGSPVLNTNGGFNLYLGNNPGATGYFVSIADTPMGATWQQLRATEGEYGASENLKNNAISWIKNNPAEFLSLTAKKAALFWWPPTHEGEGGGALEKLVRIAWLVQFLVLTVLCVASLFVVWPDARAKLLLFSMVGAYTGVHMLFYVIYRYREPIIPIVVICAAVVLDVIWKNYSNNIRINGWIKRM